MTALPIACNLTTAELEERRRTVLQGLGDALLSVDEIAGGYSYSFSASRFRELADMIDLERQCCPFLKFKLAVAAGNEPLKLEVTGPAGTKEFLAQTFAWRLG